MTTKNYLMYMLIVFLMVIAVGIFVLNNHNWEMQFVCLFLLVIALALIVNLMIIRNNKD